MATSWADRLALVRTAIDTILQRGQAYQIDGITYTRADLETLRRLEQDYAAKAAREASGGIRMRFGTPCY